MKWLPMLAVGSLALLLAGSGPLRDPISNAPIPPSTRVPMQDLGQGRMLIFASEKTKADFDGLARTRRQAIARADAIRFRDAKQHPDSLCLPFACDLGPAGALGHYVGRSTELTDLHACACRSDQKGWIIVPYPQLKKKPRTK